MGELSGPRAIPKVDRVLGALGGVNLPRGVVVEVVRRELGEIRRAHLEANPGASSRAKPDETIAFEHILARVRSALDDLRRARIQPLINATGIIIHTNLGRSPLGAEVIKSIVEIGSRYSNLEYDLGEGARGGRAAYLEHNLALLCDAERATVVNNCAAALVLALRHFTSKPPRTKVVISRGELVQIGGGFRIPEILQASGAELREIGTTNKTTIEDYRQAIDSQTAMVLKVHQSNFYMGGFVDCPSLDQLAETASRSGVPLIVDLGSGAMFDTEELGAGGPSSEASEREPTPAQVLKSGADLVTFSGDKLFGGPQAGILAGRSDYVAALKREPFFRALRCDKLILGALQMMVDLLLEGRVDEIPIRAMMRTSVDKLRARAEAIGTHLRADGISASIGNGDSQVGGGSLPRTKIPSVTIELDPAGEKPAQSVDGLATALRAGDPPVIGYIASGRLKLDLRTVFPEQDDALIGAVRRAWTLK
jgi:L-seryl-tRNA(Ser) seleniumtransferase